MAENLEPDFDRAILEELRAALRGLGASPIILHRVDAMSQQALYLEMEKLGAPPKLLGTVNGWRDGLDDQHVLYQLREWNTTGDIRFE
jgi:hypothetical protein